MSEYYIEEYEIDSNGNGELVNEQEVLQVDELFYATRDNQYYYQNSNPCSSFNAEELDGFLVDEISTETRLEQFNEMKSLPAYRKIVKKSRNSNNQEQNTIMAQHDDRTADQLPPISWDIKLTREKPVKEVLQQTSTEEEECATQTDENTPSEAEDGEIDVVTIPPQPVVSSDVIVHHMSYRSTDSSKIAGFHSEAIICSVCNSCFKNATLLERHKHYHENPTEEAPEFQILCPFDSCEVRCDMVQTVVEHVRNSHDRTDLVYEKMVFENEENYQNWVDEMQECKYAHFIRQGRGYTTRGETHRFRCGFAGKPEKEKKMMTRQRQSKKTGKACTAFYTALFRNDGIIEVSGCFCHIGHTTSPTAVPMSNSIRKEIMEFLNLGFDEKRICDILRENSTAENRRKYIQPYEVRNIFYKMKRQHSQEKNNNAENKTKRKRENGKDEVDQSCTTETLDNEEIESYESEEIFVDNDVPPFVGEEEIID